jgi:hypothetical protein
MITQTNTIALLLLAKQAAAIRITNDMKVDFHDVNNAGDINVYNGDDNCGDCDGDGDDFFDDIIDDFVDELHE